VDFAKHIIYVRQGKGRKDRMVPIGERALAWVTKYLEEVRPQLAIDPDDGVLFLTAMGDALNHSSLSTAVTERVKAAKLSKEGSCHLFRHSMATSMLENGADVRMIQAILGHASLTSTQIYTHVAIRKLQEVHAVTHPAASLEMRARSKDAQDDE
jgi:integrase/recombinase XerD